MMAARQRRAWPRDLEAGDWLADARRDLTHLGFVLRDGSLPGTFPGPRLLVALRNRPTLEHFDPEAVTWWEARDGRGCLAAGDRSIALPSVRRWSWGRIRVSDRIPVQNGFLGFGGTVLVDADDATATYLAFTSPAPIVRWAGHSQGVDPLVDEIGAFFARLMVPVECQPEAEARLAATDPEALYGVFLAHSVDRLRHARRLWDADPVTAGWLVREGRRLAAAAPARWEEGLALLDWLELG